MLSLLNVILSRSIWAMTIFCISLSCMGCQFVETGILHQESHIEKESPMKTRVLLVHGLFRTQRAMKPLHKPLEEAGYEVLDYRYYTTKLDVDSHAQDLRQHLLKLQEESNGQPLMIVGHSLGAVISVLATTPRIEGIQKVVQIAPPNLGSPVADKFEFMVGRFIAPLKELGIEQGGPLPKGVVPATPTGVIAAESDPLVPVPNTRLLGSVDHIRLPGSHTFVFWRKKTQEELIYFLEHGRFTDDAQRVEIKS